MQKERAGFDNAADKASGQKEAFMVHRVHSERYQIFHSEPIVEWPIEE